MYLHPLAGSEQSAPRPHNAASRLACGPEDVGQRLAVLKQALANVEPALAGRETADGSSWSNDPDQHGRSTAAKKLRMASRRISNIEVAGIATIVLSVAAVLAVVLLSAW